MTELVIGDACSLVNFAVVRRTDLLDRVFDGRIRCTEGVVHEVTRLAAALPGVADLLARPWFADPISLSDPLDVAAVERLRRRAFGGRPRQPLEHLGEAQSIYAISSIPSFLDAVLLTDDTSASDYAIRQQLITIDTVDVLSAAYDRGLVGCPEAYRLIESMRDRDRGVRLPRTHLEVCP